MSLKIEAAQRLMTLAVPNTISDVRDEVMHQLKAGKYQVTTKGNDLLVHNGSIANVAGAMRYKGWAFNKDRKELTHPQSDSSMRLSQSGDVTTIKFFD